MKKRILPALLVLLLMLSLFPAAAAGEPTAEDLKTPPTILGLEIHESPRASAAWTQPLPEGVIVTAEPGIYLPGKFGVRIEDMIYLTADGCRNLTRAPKELIIID